MNARPRGIKRVISTAVLCCLLSTQTGTTVAALESGKPAQRPAAPSGQTAAPFPTRWRSERTGTLKIIRIEGVVVRIETVPDEARRKRGAFSRAELTRTGDRHVGTFHEGVPCTHFGFLDRVTEKVCEFKGPFEITLLTPTRIEGWSPSHPEGTTLDCGRCRWRGDAVPETFVWLPELPTTKP